MMRFTGLLTAATLGLGVSMAGAVPVTFTYTGETASTRGASMGALVDAGDALTIEVTVDNGGSSSSGQSWRVSDTVQAVVRVGGYIATFTDNFFSPSNVAFETDAGGNLISTAWFGTDFSPTATDSFGTGARLFNLSIEASDRSRVFYGPLLGDVTYWSVGAVEGPGPVTDPTAPVPLPASAVLLLAGVLGLGAVARRRAA